MPGNQADDVEAIELLSTVPLAAFKAKKEFYRWPKKNRCPVCLVGKFRHVAHTTVIICTTCELEIHIPHEA